MTRAPGLAWIAFGGIVLIGGANFVFVKISNETLAPFWGAFLRFGAASLLLALFVLVRGIPLPRGRPLLGTVVYGVTAFGLSYALAYAVLREVAAGLAAVLFAMGPLLTMLLASLHGLERVRRRAVIGSLVAMLGVALILREQLRFDTSPLYLALTLLALVVMSESSVLVKYFPRGHPAAMNAVGMGIGAVFLLGLSVAAGEPQASPSTWRAWAAVAYLSVVGSILLFGLFLYAVARMDVSVVSYQFVLMPVVTVLLASLLIQEAVTWLFLVGGLIVAFGVFLGLRGSSTPEAAPRLVPPVTVAAAPQNAESTTDAPRP